MEWESVLVQKNLYSTLRSCRIWYRDHRTEIIWLHQKRLSAVSPDLWFSVFRRAFFGDDVKIWNKVIACFMKRCVLYLWKGQGQHRLDGEHLQLGCRSFSNMCSSFHQHIRSNHKYFGFLVRAIIFPQYSFSKASAYDDESSPSPDQA